MSETDLQRAILTALSQLGVWAIRIGSVGRRSTRGANSGEPGIPDIWTPYGWLEVKVGAGVLSPEQKAWHTKAERNGVNVYTVRSVAQAIDCLKTWQREQLTYWTPKGRR